MHDLTSWHSIHSDQAIVQIGGSLEGLSNTDAAARLRYNGPNRLPAPPKKHPFLRFLYQFHNILIYVLLCAAAITALLHHWSDTAVILAVVVANALIGFIQERKAQKALEAIRQMLSPHAAVIRDGMRMTIDSEELVYGDIVLLEAGDKVPADLRLIKVHSLQVQESILTGESVPVEKDAAKVLDKEIPIGDRHNSAFMSTVVTYGRGKGLVTGTGMHTQIGLIAEMLQSYEAEDTPLQQLDHTGLLAHQRHAGVEG